MRNDVDAPTTVDALIREMAPALGNALTDSRGTVAVTVDGPHRFERQLPWEWTIAATLSLRALVPYAVTEKFAIETDAAAASVKHHIERIEESLRPAMDAARDAFEQALKPKGDDDGAGS